MRNKHEERENFKVNLKIWKDTNNLKLKRKKRKYTHKNQQEIRHLIITYAFKMFVCRHGATIFIVFRTEIKYYLKMMLNTSVL